MLVHREKTEDELGGEDEEYREFLRLEVREDLHQLIEVDRDVSGVRESELSVKSKKMKWNKGEAKET